jgi:predicted RNase H-like HicB family nuclease
MAKGQSCDWRRTVETLKLLVTVFQDEEGWYVAECPAIPGCMSQGRTLEEVMENIHEAAELCLEVRKEKRLPLTVFAP